MTKKMKDLAALSVQELETKIRADEKSWFESRMKKVTGQLENTSSMWKLRKNIARMKTLMTQKAAKR